MTDKEIKDLAFKFIHGEISLEEEEILHQWYGARDLPSDRLVIHTEESKDDVRKRLLASIEMQKECENRPATIRQLSKKNLLRAIAASLVLFVSTGSIYFYFHKSIEAPIHHTKLLNGDVGPGGNNAILELADGSIINLDSAAIGELGSMGNLSINKQDNGLLSIDVSSSPNHAVAEKNTIRTPAGGQYQVKLPDGTRIWLNASSSITFSNAFVNETREVELSGEAFFEVAKVQTTNNKSIPFFVINKNQRIEVLGTQFNVYDFPGESIETTLLEGSVRIQSLESSFSQLLKPGQQSKVVNGAIEIKDADVESALSWKNGDFIFNNEDLFSIMKKLERWYDVEVAYSNSVVPRKFSGAVSRSKNLSEVLKIMEFTGNVTFKIEGRRVMVMM